MISDFVSSRRNLEARRGESLADAVVQLARHLGALSFFRVNDFGAQLSHPLARRRESIEHLVDSRSELREIAVSDDRAWNSFGKATLGNLLRDTLELPYRAKCHANQRKIDGSPDQERRYDYIDIDQFGGLKPGGAEEYEHRDAQNNEIRPQQLELERDAEKPAQDAWNARCRRGPCAPPLSRRSGFGPDQIECSTHWTISAVTMPNIP
jgi:hypothetical protein